MPPAKKPASRSRAAVSKKAITRQDVERATARFEKALDDASKSLQAVAQDDGVGRNAHTRLVDSGNRILALYGEGPVAEHGEPEVKTSASNAGQSSNGKSSCRASPKACSGSLPIRASFTGPQAMR